MRHLKHVGVSGALSSPVEGVIPHQRVLTDDWPNHSGNSVCGTAQASVETPCPQRRDPRDQYECAPKDTSQPSALNRSPDDEHCRGRSSPADGAADEVNRHRENVDPFVIQERVHSAEREEQRHRSDLLACAVPCDIVVAFEVARDGLCSVDVVCQQIKPWSPFAKEQSGQ